MPCNVVKLRPMYYCHYPTFFNTKYLMTAILLLWVRSASFKRVSCHFLTNFTLLKVWLLVFDVKSIDCIKFVKYIYLAIYLAMRFCHLSLFWCTLYRFHDHRINLEITVVFPWQMLSQKVYTISAFCFFL